jgi:hypothetical protein
MKTYWMHGAARLLSAAALLGLPQAHAINAANAPLPAAVDDRQLVIGHRALVLPGGPWTLVGRAEGFVKMGVDRRSTYYTVYAMDVQEGEMRAGVAMRLPVDSTPINAWRDDPCNATGFLFRDDFGEVGKHAECLLVYKRRTHLASASQEGVYAEAQQWAAAQRVALKGPFYEIYYARFGTNDFGWVRVFVPASTFAGDDEVTTWSKQLPGALKSFFEHRDHQATLPPLPRKPS